MCDVYTCFLASFNERKNEVGRNSRLGDAVFAIIGKHG